MVRRCWHKTCPVGSLLSQASPTPSKLQVATAASESTVVSPAVSNSSLQALQRRNQKLLATLSAVRWPPLVSFRLNDKTYMLPATSRTEVGETHLFKFTPGELEYLAGFFDGDGCVQVKKASRTCCLQVGQSIDGVAVLMRMQRAFGGSIRRLRDGKGLRKPVLEWALHGAGARSAASLLAPHSIVKRRQLDIILDWPSVLLRKDGCCDTLGLLKRSDSAVAAPCTWAYFAGFFDAEGCIAQQGGQASFSLRLTQKYATILMCLRSFLAREMGLEAKIYCGYQNRSYELAITKTQHCKLVLQKMLNSGLLRKAAEANLAVDLAKDNAVRFRDARANMVGNQAFAKTLDTAGLERSQAIATARQRAKRAAAKGQKSLAEAILAEIEQQKWEHEVLNALALNKRLRAYLGKIRGMYQEPCVYNCDKSLGVCEASK